MKHPMVRVDWVDACGALGWASLSEVVKKGQPDPVASVGFLVKSTKQEVVLVLSMGNEEDPETNGWICIPRVNVLKITELTEKRK